MMTQIGENRLLIVEMTFLHYQRLTDQGYVERDIAALFTLKKKLFVGGEV